MLKFNHFTLIILSGLLWLAVGTFLLTLGLNLLVEAARYENALGLYSYPLIDNIAPYVAGWYNAAVLLIALSLAIGYFKARFVLSKSVTRITRRITTLPNPASLFTIYNAPYYLLIGLMICLGIAIKFFGLTSDIRGVVDVTIGSALINGSVLYFRTAKKVTA